MKTMIVDSHQHVMLPTTMQIQKMNDAGVDKAILFTTTPHVERAATATLDAIGAEMQVLYHHSGAESGYPGRARPVLRFWPGSAGAFRTGNSRVGIGVYRWKLLQRHWRVYPRLGNAD